MILPFFRQLFEFARYPVTWLILILNVVLFFGLTPGYQASQTAMEDLVGDPRFLEAQAQVFAAMILEKPEAYAAPLSQLAHDLRHGRGGAADVLGRLSLRNARFMQKALQFRFKGDRVLHREWQASFTRFSLLRESHPNFNMGLSSSTDEWSSYVSYQFVHGGAGHQLVNMLVLLLVGCVLEPLIGGAALLALYLVCGAGAALGFLFLNGSSPVPLVGASGSIMGLFGVLVGLRFQEPLRFVWFLPTARYTGYVWLPVWMFVGYLLLSDLAGFLQTASWIGGGVAHAAHLSGTVTGVLMGVILRAYKPHTDVQDDLLFSLSD